MTKRPCVLLDLDDILNKFVPYLLETYNKMSGDNLTEEEVTDWEIPKFVLPEWKDRIFSKEITWRDGFFFDVPIQDGAVDFVNKLMEWSDVYIVSACYFATVPDKANWIMKHFPLFDIRRFIPCYDKKMIKGDVLLDDAPHNLVSGDYLKVMMNKPHNRHIETNTNPFSKNYVHRVNDLVEAYDVIERLVRRKDDVHVR